VAKTMKNISILGSTGSIGTQTLELVDQNKSDYNVIGLTCNKNIELLSKQIKKFKVSQFHSNIKFDSSAQLKSPIDIATNEKLDKLVVSTEGLHSLKPTLMALESSIEVGIANKESILCGYEFMKKSMNNNSKLIPLDSEPVSVKNLLIKSNKQVNKIIITASGGPFRNKKSIELSNIKPDEAANHPTWRMGKKISVDSATLMNKAFEVLECNLLFEFPLNKIDVIINPSSSIHALVEYIDGSILASQYEPDMRIPISEFLTNSISPLSDHIYLNKKDLRKPKFEIFNSSNYPAYEIGLHYGKRRGSWIIALCAADQAAIDLFLDYKIKFLDIPKVIEIVLSNHIESKVSNIIDVYRIYSSTIQETYKLTENKWN
tara:strand:+ start:1998 stop:3122 length:1125 start_codon:yes stop_codon:yes gene_type:complete